MKRAQYKWGMVGILCLIATINYADRTAISSVFPMLHADLNASDVELGAIGSFFLWTYAFASPVWGYLADRVSRSRMVVASLIAWSIVTLSTAFVRNIDQLLFTRVLLGISESAYLPASLALIADHHQSDSRGTAIGFHLAGLNLGLVVGGAGAGYIADHYSWRFSFVVLGVVGFCLALLALAFLRDYRSPGASRNDTEQTAALLSTIRGVLQIRSYLILLGEAMLLSIGLWAFFNWLPMYFHDTFYMSMAGAGFSGTFILQIAAVIGIVFGGWLSDRVAGHRSARRMLMMSLCYFIAAPFLFAFSGHNTLTVVGLCLFLHSLFLTLGQANEGPLICDLLPPRCRSTAFGLWNMANCITGGMGILLTGYLKHRYGLSGIFQNLAATVLTAACLVLIGYIYFVRKDLEQSPSHFINEIPVLDS